MCLGVLSAIREHACFFFDVHKLLHYARKIGALANAAEGVVQFAVECVELVVTGLVFWLRTIAYQLERGHCLLRGTEIAVTALSRPGQHRGRDCRANEQSTTIVRTELLP